MTWKNGDQSVIVWPKEIVLKYKQKNSMFRRWMRKTPQESDRCSKQFCLLFIFCCITLCGVVNNWTSIYTIYIYNHFTLNCIFSHHLSIYCSQWIDFMPWNQKKKAPLITKMIAWIKCPEWPKYKQQQQKKSFSIFFCLSPCEQRKWSVNDVYVVLKITIIAAFSFRKPLPVSSRFPFSKKKHANVNISFNEISRNQ